MKAVVYAKVGKPEESLSIRELAKPSPKSNQVLEKLRLEELRQYSRDPVTIPRLLENPIVTGWFAHNKDIHEKDPPFALRVGWVLWRLS